jgi:NAD(P)-dependent dehydrogenase (short-subunit alcohol dehydrogenase family)
MAYNPYSLESKLILVTGAGTGIGRGVALEAARQGADVALQHNASTQGAQETVADIQAMGRRAVALRGDLSRVDECRRVVSEAVAFLGGLDGLVNNAGITATVFFADVTEAQFDRLFHVNIRGQFFCAQQAMPHLVERGRELQRRFPERPWAGGSIVNMASVHGLVGCPGRSEERRVGKEC